jgi:hypothetical protein
MVEIVFYKRREYLATIPALGGSMEILPPPTFDHVFKGHLVERRGSLADIKNYCHTRHGIISAYQALGCAKVSSHHCFIMIPRVGGQISASLQSEIRRHEIAHCNGWAADHPH